jgi:hypothetical protein
MPSLYLTTSIRISKTLTELKANTVILGLSYFAKIIGGTNNTNAKKWNPFLSMKVYVIEEYSFKISRPITRTNAI